jgi:2-methylcitrate dehydratase PrpD
MTESALGPTSTLAEYALSVDGTKLPTDVLAQARVVLADMISILLAASRKPAVATSLRAFPLTDSGQCTVVGHGRLATPEQAAFVNGVGAHDLELDDTHASSRTHAAAAIVPAALAAAEAAGGVSGADLLAGMVAAYDVQCRTSKAMGVQNQFDRNFHPTSVNGSIGAAVAAGRILGLSVPQLTSAIGLAGSQSSGTMAVHDDPSHMVKSFQTGIAARNGVYAALLAANGFVGMPDLLTGPHDFLATYGGPQTYPDELTAELGERFEITGTSIKLHSGCGMTHSAIDAVLGLMDDHGLTWTDIEAIDAALPHNAVTVINDHPLWTHNIQYVLALAAHQRWVGPDHFTPEWTTNPEIAALKSHVTLRGSERLDERFPAKKGAIVRITGKLGEYEREVEAPAGTPYAPLADHTLRSKFDGLATSVLPPAVADVLWGLLSKAESLADTAPIFAVIGAATSNRE